MSPHLLLLLFIIQICLAHSAEKSSTSGSAREAIVKGATSAEVDGFMANELQRVDAKVDGWDSEVFYDEVKPRLQQLTKAIATRPSALTKDLSALIADKLTMTPLRPPSAEVTEITTAVGFAITRAKHNLANLPEEPGDFFTQAQSLLQPFDPSFPVVFKTKIYRVTQEGHKGSATAYIDITGKTTDGHPLQHNATWETHWQRTDASSPWVLSRLILRDFEEVRSKSKDELFSEATESVLGQTQAWTEQLRYSMDHWRLRLDYRLGLEPGSVAGLSLADVNGDGRDDLFYADSGGLPKRLFLQKSDGTLQDVTAESGLNYLDRCQCAAFADFDNDGDQDAVLAFDHKIIFFANDGQARFQKKAEQRIEPRAHSLAVADYDRDGWLDLYVCSYGRDFSGFGEEGVPIPWYDANNGAPNSLWRNLGNGQWANVTSEVGLDTNNRKYSYAASWDDVDDDGWPDLYVANDFGRNNLYKNDGGKFTDIAIAAGADDPSPGMACSWGDINGDGRMDIHVSNMFSGAGNRITTQPRYKANSSPEILASHQRFARGNSLLINQGQGKFKDVSEATQITLGRWAWGNQIADVNNDGWPDLLTGNGFLSGPDVDDL